MLSELYNDAIKTCEYLAPIFVKNIDSKQCKIIFELGSWHLIDAFKLYEHYTVDRFIVKTIK